MHIAVGIGALLLGGWVLNSPVAPDGDLAERMIDTESELPAAPSMQPGRAPYRTQDAGPSRGRESSGRRRADSSAASEEQGQPAQPRRERTGMMMPVTPTEEADEDLSSAVGLPAPPTAQSTVGYGAGRMPMAPTARRSGRGEASSGAMQSVAVQQQLDRSAAQASGGQKAFAGYRHYGGGVSPYMNLYRNDTAGGTIDNYTTLVRPALDQRSQNQRFNDDIYGLERSARIQNSALQQLNRGARTRTLQSVATPQFYLQTTGGMPQNYMNYGNYYPTYGQ